MSIAALGIAPSLSSDTQSRVSITSSTTAVSESNLPPYDPKLEPTIAGPFKLFKGSCEFEFCRPAPWRNGSVLIKARYKMKHEMWRNNPAGHPQLPPLHLHFNQAETVQVVSGALQLTVGYDSQPIAVAAGGTYLIPAKAPHIVGPPIAGPDEEDVVIVVWAHPHDTKGDMDHVWFLNLFMHVSDAVEGKGKVDIGRVLLMQQESESSLVMLPSAWWLGSLRWRIPYAFQTSVAWIARMQGKTALTENYSKMARG